MKRFVSTRGGDTATFEEAISTGYAKDGGLYMPRSLPVVGTQELQAWAALTYPQLCTEILSRFIGEEEIPRAQLMEMMGESFAGFLHPDVVPVTKIGNQYLSELYHGPSFSFKDIGLQVVCRLLNYFATKRRIVYTLLVSTTGDTGPAAIEACSSLPALRLVCVYPKGQVSDLQRKQMVTRMSGSVRVFAFEGGGDDMDPPIKSMATDPEFQAAHNVTSVNSINICRVMAQTVHFFWTYLRVIAATNAAVGDEVDFAVPCGALGNITAGLISKRMGLPVGKLVGGTNVNDVFHRLVSTGVFERSPEMYPTLSEAINIQIPYNLERILFILSAADSQKVAKCMLEIAKTGKVKVGIDLTEALQAVFTTRRVTDEEVLAKMKHLHTEYDVVIDPHTAVGVLAADKQASAAPLVTLSTAHPCKFQTAVCRSLGEEFWEKVMPLLHPSSMHTLLTAPEIQRGVFEVGQDWEVLLRSELPQMFRTPDYTLPPPLHSSPPSPSGGSPPARALPPRPVAEAEQTRGGQPGWGASTAQEPKRNGGGGSKAGGGWIVGAVLALVVVGAVVVVVRRKGGGSVTEFVSKFGTFPTSSSEAL